MRRVLAITAIALIIAFIASQLVHRAAERAFQDSLASAIATCRRTSSTLDLTQATDFQWDRVDIFGPYTPPSQIEKALATRWTGTSSVESGKGLNLFVFTRGKTIVNYFDVPRRIADIAVSDTGIAFSRDNAKFQVSASESNWIVLTPAK